MLPLLRFNIQYTSFGHTHGMTTDSAVYIRIKKKYSKKKKNSNKNYFRYLIQQMQPAHTTAIIVVVIVFSLHATVNQLMLYLL